MLADLRPRGDDLAKGKVASFCLMGRYVAAQGHLFKLLTHSYAELETAGGAEFESLVIEVSAGAEYCGQLLTLTLVRLSLSDCQKFEIRPARMRGGILGEVTRMVDWRELIKMG